MPSQARSSADTCLLYTGRFRWKDEQVVIESTFSSCKSEVEWSPLDPLSGWSVANLTGSGRGCRAEVVDALSQHCLESLVSMVILSSQTLQ